MLVDVYLFIFEYLYMLKYIILILTLYPYLCIIVLNLAIPPLFVVQDS